MRWIGHIYRRLFSPKNFGWFVASSADVYAWRIAYKDDGVLSIDEDSTVSARVCFDREGAKVKIGKNTFIGKSTIVCASKITIGDGVLISWGVTIVDHDSHSINSFERDADLTNWKKGEKRWESVAIDEVTIHDKAWIGFNAIVLKGVSIGESAIVGAGSVVTRDVPSFTIVAGNPARVIRELVADEG